MNQSFTTDDALYGLRNLAIGDDEQTRIEDHENVLTPDARRALDAGDFDLAYTLMIVPALATFTRDEVAALASAWAASFLADDDCDETPADLAADMMNVYDELHAR